MKNVKYLVFRHLTNAEFFNIYKPTGTEVKGGGQGYIDFPTKSVPLKQWGKFFDGSIATVTSRASGPSWNLPIHSINLKKSQDLTIYQRRPQSVSIAAQKITSRESNRVLAWHPDNGFPYPIDPKNRKSVPPGLAVYILRTDSGEFWAGWFQDKIPSNDQKTLNILKQLKANSIDGHSGFIEFQPNLLFFDETSISNTFYSNTPSTKAPEQQLAIPVVPTPPQPKSQYSVKKPRTEEEITKNLFEDDEDVISIQPKLKEVVQKIKIRNTKAVSSLKELYQGRCQITGKEFCFIKKDGSRYCEAHHLIPLGDQGSDSLHNIIIVSPLIHRMLHYADVSPINLSEIKADHTLDIKINGNPYTIKWHPKHADCVRKATPQELHLF